MASKSNLAILSDTIIQEIVLQNVLPNAPRVLVRQYEHPNYFPMKLILGRLLTSNRMIRTWDEIEKRFSKNAASQKLSRIKKQCFLNQQYDQLSESVYHAYRQSSSVEPTRSARRQHFQNIAETSNRLMSLIADGPLDLLIYNYFSAGRSEELFHSPDWSRLNPDQRRLISMRKLRAWPSLVDVLNAVAADSQQRAREAMTEERVIHRVRRHQHVSNKRRQRAIYFIRHLADPFRRQLNGQMHGSLANIASAAFGHNYTKQFVKQALRHVDP